MTSLDLFDPKKAFKEHWKQIRRVIETTGPWSTQKSRESVESAISSVRAHLNSLTELLVSELRESASLGTVFEFCFEEQLFKKLCVWALQPGAYQTERVVDQLRMYEESLEKVAKLDSGTVTFFEVES